MPLPALALALLVAAAAQPSPRFIADAKDPRQRLLSALVEELERSQRDLHLRDHQAPYFLSYAVRGSSAQEVGAKYGSIFFDQQRRERRLPVHVRVGSYQLDNSAGAEPFDIGRPHS